MRGPVLVVVLVALAAGVWVLREQTMTVHQPVPEDSSLQLLVLADGRTDQDPVVPMTRAQVELCTAESIPGTVLSSFAQVDHPEAAGGEVTALAFTLRPGADPPDRDQLHGCLEDLRVRHLRLEVEQMTYREAGQIVEERDT